MKVRDAMTSDVGYCQPNTSLAQTAMIMWQRDCGIVPVVNEQQRVVGMITDRDICIAVSMQNRLASQITVGEIIYGEVKSCRPEDDLEDALKMMKKRQLRRLPVTSKDGVLLGIISIGDLLNAAKSKALKKKLLAALREISSFRPLQMREISADTDNQAESEADLNFHESIQTNDETADRNESQNQTASNQIATHKIDVSDEDDARPALRTSNQL